MALEKARYQTLLKTYQEKLEALKFILTDALKKIFSVDDDLVFDPGSRPLFFVLTEQLKALDGFFISSLLKANKEKLGELIRGICQKNPLYLFDGTKLSIDVSKISAKFYDGNTEITLEELCGMSDLSMLFKLNAYDLPLCASTIDRSVWENFFSTFLQKIRESFVQNPDVSEVVEFDFLEQGIPHVAISINSWVKSLYFISAIFKNINTSFKLAFAVIQLNYDFVRESFPDSFPLDEFTRFFDEFSMARDEFLGLIEKKLQTLETVKEKDLDILPDKFKSFIRIEFKNIMKRGAEADEMLPSVLFKYYVKDLADLVRTTKYQCDIAFKVLGEFKSNNKLKAMSAEFCDQAINFIAEFRKFLNLIIYSKQVINLKLDEGVAFGLEEDEEEKGPSKGGPYEAALKAGVSLLDICPMESVAYNKVRVTRASSSANSGEGGYPGTPRSAGGTPRAGTPRSGNIGSPRSPRGQSGSRAPTPRASSSSPRTEGAQDVKDSPRSPRATGRADRSGLSRSMGGGLSGELTDQQPRRLLGPSKSGDLSGMVIRTREPKKTSGFFDSRKSTGSASSMTASDNTIPQQPRPRSGSFGKSSDGKNTVTAAMWRKSGSGATTSSGSKTPPLQASLGAGDAASVMISAVPLTGEELERLAQNSRQKK